MSDKVTNNSIPGWLVPGSDQQIRTVAIPSSEVSALWRHATKDEDGRPAKGGKSIRVGDTEFEVISVEDDGTAVCHFPGKVIPFKTIMMRGE